METTYRPIMYHLLTQLESFKTKKIQFISKGITHGSPQVTPDDVTKSLTTQTYDEIEKIRIHGFSISSCILLHPGLRSFSFMSLSSYVEKWKSIGNTMIRQMMESYHVDKPDGNNYRTALHSRVPIISFKSSDFSLNCN